MGEISIVIFLMSLVQILVGSYTNLNSNGDLIDDAVLMPNYTFFTGTDMLPPLLPPNFDPSDYDERDNSDANAATYEKDKSMNEAVNPFSYFNRDYSPPSTIGTDLNAHTTATSARSNKSGGGGFGKIDISIQYGCCHDGGKDSSSKTSHHKSASPSPSPTDPPVSSSPPSHTRQQPPNKNCQWNCNTTPEHVGTIEIQPDLNKNTTSNSRFEDIANVPFYLSPERSHPHFYNDNSALLPSSVLPPFLIEPTRPFHSLPEPPRYVFSPRFDDSASKYSFQPRNTENAQNYNQQQTKIVRKYMNGKKKQLYYQNQPMAPTQYKQQPNRRQDLETNEDPMKAYSNFYSSTSTMSPIQNRGKLQIQPSEPPAPFPATLTALQSADRGALYVYGGLIPPSVSIAPQAVSVAPFDRGHVHRSTPSASATSPSSMIATVGPTTTSQYYGNHVTPRSVLRAVENRFGQQNAPRRENYGQNINTAQFIHNITSNLHSNGNSNNQDKYYTRSSEIPVYRIPNISHYSYDFYRSEEKPEYRSSPRLQVFIRDKSNNNRNSNNWNAPFNTAISTPINMPINTPINMPINTPISTPSPINSKEDLIRKNRATFNQMQSQVYKLFTEAAFKDFRERLRKSIENKKIKVMEEEEMMLQKSDMPQQDINIRILDYLTIYERYSDRLNDTELRGHILQDMERARDYLNMKLNKFWLELDTMQTSEVFLQKKNYYKSREKPPGIMNVFYDWYEDLICKPSEVNESVIRDRLVEIMKKEKRYWLLLLKT